MQSCASVHQKGNFIFHLSDFAENQLKIPLLMIISQKYHYDIEIKTKIHNPNDVDEFSETKKNVFVSHVK